MYKPTKLEAKDFQSFEALSYDFEIGKAILIEGENRTDEGQKTNGSGKTSFAEMIYYLLLGSSSTGKRDLKLVRWGCKQAKLSLTLHNEFLKHDLKIERTLFSNSKSSTLDIFINGESQKSRFATVTEGNKLILELLDISAEDLKNYFLVNRKRFVSFFDSPDSAKRSLLARFSNIDRIQQVVANIDETLKDRQEEHTRLTREEIACQSKIDLLQNQIAEHDPSIAFADKKAAMEQQIESCKARTTGIDGELNSIDAKITNNQKECDKEQKNLEAGREKIKTLQSINYDEKLAENASKQAEQREQAEKIWQNKKNIDADCTELTASLGPVLVMLEKTITCPNCHTEFVVGNEGVDLQEARMLVEETQKEIQAMKKKAAELEMMYEAEKKSNIVQQLMLEKNSILEQQSETNRQISKIKTTEIAPATMRINALERETGNLRTQRARLIAEKESCLSKQTKLEQELQTLMTSPIDSGDQEKWIAQANEELDKLENIHAQQTKLDEYDARDRMWKERINQFYVYLTNKTLSLIQSHCNYCLDTINSDLRLKFEGFKTLADGKIKESVNAVIARNGQEEEDYKCFSGGEQGRMVFSTILTFQELINEKSKSGGLDLLLIDEVLDQVDSMGLGLFVHSLTPLQKTIFIVSQVKTEAPIENTLLIVKEHGISRISSE